MSTPTGAARPSQESSITESPASESSIKEWLSAGFAGELVGPADQEYPAARSVWNGMVDRYPAVVARVSGVEDVRAAVRLAAERGLPLAVRGGGHNVAGLGTCDGGITVDLGRLSAVDVDADRRIARVGGGATWAALDAATAAYGLATPGGLVSSTGVGGLTLGGGIGHLVRRYGLTCDNLVAADMVTADGRVVRADEAQNPELLWALRGSGGNFGVVTAFEFRLHPCAVVTGGMLLYSGAKAREALAAHGRFCAAAPDEVTTVAALLTAPPEPFVPEPMRGKPALGIAGCHCADAAADPGPGAAAFTPLRSAVPPDVDLIQPMPYIAVQQMLDASAPRGMRDYWKPGFLAGLPDELIDTVVGQAAAAPSPLSAIHLHQLGGAVRDADIRTSPFGHRDAAFALNVVGMWPDPATDADNIRWARESWSAIEPFTQGAYLNFLAAEDAARTRSAFDPESWARLVRVKQEWDPQNLFRVNHNIPPTG